MLLASCGPKAEAERVLAPLLRDPDSIEVVDMIRSAKTGAWCGSLSAANGFGGRSQPRIFYVLDGRGEIAPQIESDPTEAILADQLGEAVRRLGEVSGFGDTSHAEFMERYGKACNFG